MTGTRGGQREGEEAQLVKGEGGKDRQQQEEEEEERQEKERRGRGDRREGIGGEGRHETQGRRDS